MKKDKVFIVVTQIRSLKTKSASSWQVTEKVEFVDQLRKKHITLATAVGDYLNKKMVIGANKGVTDYDKFEAYVREKYPKQLEQLDAHFRPETVVEAAVEEVPADDRAVTVEGDNVVVAE